MFVNCDWNFVRYVPHCLIDNTPALFQGNSWVPSGPGPLTEAMLAEIHIKKDPFIFPQNSLCHKWLMSHIFFIFQVVLEECLQSGADEAQMTWWLNLKM